MANLTSKMKRRGMIAVAVLLVLGFGTDLFRLFYIQIIKGDEYKMIAESQQLSDTTISANRGVIYDRNGNVLAQSASAWLVYVNPSKVVDDAQRQLIANGLSEILGDTKPEKVLSRIQNVEYSYVKIAGKLEYETKTALQEFIDKNELYGIVSIDPDTKRYYPYSNFASTLLGFTGAEDTGRAGLELKYNDTLTGVAGRLITAKNGVQDAMDSSYETSYAAQQGTSLVLTIDQTIQSYLEKGLRQAVKDNKAAAAYGIVMDVKTGAVLGMATMPDYDLNNPTVITDKTVLKGLKKYTDEAAYDKAYNEKIYSMWRNRAISDTYEPGSVFKIFTASSALEEGVVDANFRYSCTGSIRVADNTIHCHNWSGHGTQDLMHGLMNSCNPFFITVGQKLGTKKFSKYFEAFGFTEQTGIDLPGEASPVADVTYHSLENMGIAELSSSAFGQSFQVSAIQMITGVSCVANGGYLMKPYIVASMQDETGKTIYEAKPTVRRQVISGSTSTKMMSMLEQVVADGTGRNAYVPGYRIAGKTGTSEKLTVRGEYIASFVGCAPADDPEIAVLIVIDEPQGEVYVGGAIAAPVAGSVIEQVLQYMNVEPIYTNEELSQLNGSAPDVCGMTVEEAQKALKSKGFTARVIGDGKEVISQYPLALQTIPMDGVVILYTKADSGESDGTIPVLTGLSISDANARAVEAGFNLKISGTSLDSEVVSYRQSIAEGTTAPLGTTVTVYFKTTQGVNDD